MQFEWGKAKNRANLAKHGVDFADAVTIFEDDLALTRPDSEARTEPRFVRSASMVLVVTLWSCIQNAARAFG